MLSVTGRVVVEHGLFDQSGCELAPHNELLTGAVASVGLVRRRKSRTYFSRKVWGSHRAEGRRHQHATTYVVRLFRVCLVDYVAGFFR